MTLEEVLAHNPITNSDYPTWYLIAEIIISLTVILAVISLLATLVYSFIVKEKKEKRNLRHTSLIILGFICFTSFVYTLIFPMMNDMLIDDWSTDYVEPYLKSLPTLKTDTINKLKFNKPSFFDRNKSASNNTITFSYKGKPVTRDDVPVKFDLTPNSKPFITYKYNPNSFSGISIASSDINDYENGIYKVILHLPIDYKLN